MSDTVRFMFLFRGGAVTKPLLSAEVRQEQLNKWSIWTNELRAKNHLAPGGYPLQAASKLIRGPAQSQIEEGVQDGIELVTGNLVVQASSMDQALTLARGCPILDFGGSVEVRQVLERPI
jgi:hypothetical protein